MTTAILNTFSKVAFRLSTSNKIGVATSQNTPFYTFNYTILPKSLVK